MSKIVLSTLNARYDHCAFGLRYLLANLGELRADAVLREFTIHDPPATVAEKLMAESPALIAFGVSIWNLRETAQVMAILRRVAPAVRLVVGGPEVSHGSEDEPVVRLADVLITGEADLTFPMVCRELLAGSSAPAAPRVIHSQPPDLAQVRFPYDLYTDHDLAHRLVYVEATRGCPCACEFCLSSLTQGLRAFPLDGFLAEMGRLIDRGCRTFKFVDRSFNLSLPVALAVLAFILERWQPGMFLHLELVPDHLDDGIKCLLERFPAGAIQVEVGIQSFDPAVCARVSRHLDADRVEANLHFLREHTGVRIHADLIVGLPGETMASLAAGFDRLWTIRPQEIQLGILKLLKGTALVRHLESFALVFSPEPPYELLQNRDFSFADLQRLKRLARFLELFANRDRFTGGVALLTGARPSAFAALLEFADWVWECTGQEHAFSLAHQHELLGKFLRERRGCAEDLVRATLAADFLRHGAAKNLPEFLRSDQS
jgi:hypothetical protein